MIRFLRASFAVFGGVATGLTATSGLTAQSPGEAADRVLSVRSVVSGEPRWAPDGQSLMIQSGLGGGAGLWSVSPDGAGFPRRMVENLGTVPYQSAYMAQWSPTGEWVAYASGKTGATEIWLWSARNGRSLQLTALGQTRINSMSWSPDGRSIAFAGDRYGSYDIWTVAVPTGATKRLTTDGRYEVYPSWTPDGRTLLYVQLDDRWVDHDIMAIPANGGAARLVARDTSFFDYGAGRTFGYPMVSPDGREVLFRSHRSGWINYWIAPLEGGAARQLVAEPADQSDAAWSPDGRSVIYVSNRNGTHDLRIVASSGGAPRVVVAPPNGLGVVGNPDVSPDGKRVAFTMSTPTSAADLYLAPLAGGAPTRLTVSEGLGVGADDLVTPEKVKYRSSDGLEISAYLYRPKVAAGQRVPGILFIHGGPTSQFQDSYQSQVQFFVSQGYALLLPNIRGSSGYGRAFEDANNREWGHADLEDVKAGAEFLKRLDYVDAGRIGITGTSYGGCMTMSAVAFAPGFFQAAVAASGYGDWLDFYQEQEYRHLKLLDYEFGKLGPDTEAIYRRSSPYFSIAEVQTPIMLVHGEGRFPGSHASARFAEQLERYYKVFRYQTYPNENYYVSSRANQRKMFLDMLDFFDQYLKDRTDRGVAAESGR